MEFPFKSELISASSSDESESADSSASAHPPPVGPTPPPLLKAPVVSKTKKKKPKVLRAMTSTIGAPRAFEPKSDDIEMWWNMFKSFLLANDLDTAKCEVKCVGILLSSIGLEHFTLLSTLLSPDEPSKCALVDLKTVLLDYFKPAPKAITERFKFTGRKQEKRESVPKF